MAGTELEAGSQTLDSAELAKVLTATSSQETEAERTPNIDAVWTGIAQAVGTGKAPATMPAGVSGFDDLATRLLAGPVGARGLPVTAFAPKTPNIEGKDLALLDRAEQLMVFASIAPGSMSRPSDGLAVRIVAPPGSEARVKDAIAILLYSGYNIASVDLTGQPRDATEVLVYDDSVEVDRRRAQAVLRRLHLREADVAARRHRGDDRARRRLHHRRAPRRRR